MNMGPLKNKRTVGHVMQAMIRTGWVEEGLREAQVCGVLITSRTLGRGDSDISAHAVWYHWRQRVHVVLWKWL